MASSITLITWCKPPHIKCPVDSRQTYRFVDCIVSSCRHIYVISAQAPCNQANVSYVYYYHLVKFLTYVRRTNTEGSIQSFLTTTKIYIRENMNLIKLSVSSFIFRYFFALECKYYAGCGWMCREIDFLSLTFFVYPDYTCMTWWAKWANFITSILKFVQLVVITWHCSNCIHMERHYNRNKKKMNSKMMDNLGDIAAQTFRLSLHMILALKAYC